MTATQRRSRLMYAAVLVLVGGLMAVLSTAQAGARREVLVAAKPWVVGQTITAEEVRVARLNSDADVAAVRSSDRAAVVGSTARADAVPGQLITSAMIGAPAGVASRAVVGIVVKPGQAPSGLRAGDRVSIVVDLGTQADGAGFDASPVLASVVSVAGTATSGVRAIDLAIDPVDASRLAAATSSARFTVVRLP